MNPTAYVRNAHENTCLHKQQTPHKFLSWPFNILGLLAKEKTNKIT
jgi:hypothetical protein